MQYLTAYGALVMFGGLKRGDFVLITAASSSVGLAAIQIVKAEGAIPIAATRKSDKRAQLLALGAPHVIATEEEDLIARVNEITGGNGARLIFDPVGGPSLEKLVEAAAYEGIVFLYGLLSMQPTPFPVRPALRKGLTLTRLFATRDPPGSAIVEGIQTVCVRSGGRWAIPSEDRQDISSGTVERSLRISRIEPTGG